MEKLGLDLQFSLERRCLEIVKLQSFTGRLRLEGEVGGLNMKPDEIRKMSHGEREKKLRELRTELMLAPVRIKKRKFEGSVKEIKKDIARILTINREEEI